MARPQMVITGLGRCVVRELVTDHRGTIRFDSEVGHGTRCTLTFPLLTDGEGVDRRGEATSQRAGD